MAKQKTERENVSLESGRERRRGSLFVKTCLGEQGDRPPVWFMRQAGRCLPEYRELRQRHGFFEMVREPELASEVTLQPIRRFNYDAAIIFADILPPLSAMGLHLDFVEGRGPVIHNPVRVETDVRRLREPQVDHELNFVAEALLASRSKLNAEGFEDTPLIGFAGAPFTMAAYAVEGSGSKHHENLKQLLYEKPGVFRELLDKIAETTVDYLKMQVEAGADAVQLFDSQAGILSPWDFDEFARPATEKVLSELAELDVPRIYFIKNGGGLLRHLPEDMEVLGLDWVNDFRTVREVTNGAYRALQGNLDPVLLLGDEDTVAARVQRMLADYSEIGPWIFNLGHGVLKDSRLEAISAAVETVRNFSY